MAGAQFYHQTVYAQFEFFYKKKTVLLFAFLSFMCFALHPKAIFQKLKQVNVFRFYIFFDENCW